MREMDVKMLSAVDGIATGSESRMAITESRNDSENMVVEETKTVTRRTKK